MTAIWTILTHATRPHARVLARAAARHHPEAEVLAVAVGPSGPGGEPYTEIPAAEVAPWLPGDLDAWPWEVLQALLRVAVLEHGLRLGHDPVLLLDGDVDVRAPLTPLLAPLDRRAMAVVPRVVGDLPADDHRPSASDHVASGMFATALIAVRPHPATEGILASWRAAIEATLERVGPAADFTRDPWVRRQLTEWLDLAPAVHREVGVVRDPGVGASAWNLHERPLEHVDGEIRAGGRPLRALHFEGFDPRRPWWLSADADRVRVPDDRVLAELCAERASALLNAGWTRDDSHDSEVPLGTRLSSGVVFDARIQRACRRAALAGETFGQLTTPEGADRLRAWLEAPAPNGGGHGVTRFAAAVWAEREDVRAAFADLDDADTAAAFLQWIWLYGRHELDLPVDLLPGRPSSAGVDAVAERAQAVESPPAVEITGFLSGTLGLGAAARLFVDALSTADVPIKTRTVSPPGRVPSNFSQVDFDERAAEMEPELDLIFVNPDELPLFLDQRDAPTRSGRRTVGIWAWETDHVPERWAGAYELLDEIWVHSPYVQQVISRASPVPVVDIPIPVPVPDPAGIEFDLGVREGFCFLFTFDFLSTSARKNPDGLIRAFSRAFAPGEGPQLVIKTLHAELKPMQADALRWLAGDRPDIHVFDASLTAAQRDALIASCDCYVSLHRSEGFGISLAEAMRLGKPTIATGFSGNLAFMSRANSHLVDYTLRRIGEDAEHYPPEGTWAEPDLDHAAQLMRHVVEHPDAAWAVGEQGRRDTERLLAPEVVGHMVAARLRRLREHRELPGARPVNGFGRRTGVQY